GKLGREDREVRQVEWLTEPELRRFLEKAKGLEPHHYPALLTLATTGIRQGEALGLQVGDVDLARGKLSVRRAVRRYKVGSPKSGQPRTVDMPPATAGVLGEWLEVVRPRPRCGARSPSGCSPAPRGTSWRTARSDRPCGGP
ncbi:MAG TPA: tyrosine-type recombinase/integrase, partial [Candidatus Methylomirabilis sp.]